MDTTRFEISATSVTFEQENLTSPIKLYFRAIQRVQVEEEIGLYDSFSGSPMVLWRDYLIGTFVRVRPTTRGLFLWDMRENSIFYFEVCHSFRLPGALNPNSQQMGFVPLCPKVIDDLLFVNVDVLENIHRNTAYRCIHIPSLAIVAQLPGGSLSLTQNAFSMLPTNCIMESRAMGSNFSANTKIYSIQASLPTHPRYCFMIKRSWGQSMGLDWEVFEVEIDLSIPGPIKIFSRVSQPYTVRCPTYPLHGSNADLLLYLPSGRGDLPSASLGLQFLRVRKPGKERVARLGGADEMRLTGLSVDKDAGYVILWAAQNWPEYTGDCFFVWWLGETKPGNMVYSQTKELISSWSRRLLQRFWW